MANWMPAPEPIDDGSICNIDRRSSVRRAPIIPGTHVWTFDGRRISVEIIDESLHGVGLVIAQNQSFEFGPKVVVEFNGRRREAAVAHIARQPDSSYRIGLKWLSPAASS